MRRQCAILQLSVVLDNLLRLLILLSFLLLLSSKQIIDLSIFLCKCIFEFLILRLQLIEVKLKLLMFSWLYCNHLLPRPRVVLCLSIFKISLEFLDLLLLLSDVSCLVANSYNLELLFLD